MKLLVINFEMDRLSRTMPWSPQVVDLLARSCERVVVLTSRVGQYQAPPNVQVEALRFPRLIGIPVARWLLIALANGQAFRLVRRHKLEACFIHMASHWAFYLSPCFRLLGLPVLVWYAHGAVNRDLHRAHRAATRVVTSTPEGFRIPSDKVRVIGQGIDTDLFKRRPQVQDRRDILAVTRISPRKRIELLIQAMRCLREKPGALALRLRLIGTPVTREDQYYELELRDQVWRLGLQDWFEFTGFVPQAYIPGFYRSAFLHLNVSRTGSMDKTVMESLATGTPVLTGNEAFRELLKDYPEFLLQEESPEAVAERVLELYARRDSYDPEALRGLVAGKHDIHHYVQKVLENLEEIRNP